VSASGSAPGRIRWLHGVETGQQYQVLCCMAGGGHYAGRSQAGWRIRGMSSLHGVESMTTYKHGARVKDNRSS